MCNLLPQVSGALFGASISLITAIIVLIFTNSGHNKRQTAQHEHKQKMEDRKHLKSTLERCYLSFAKWETYFSSVYVGMIGFVKGDLTEERASEIGRGRSQSGSNEEVEMLISLYFPNLKEKYEIVRAARGEIVKFFPPNAQNVGKLQSYYEAQEDFESKARDLKNAISSVLENL